LGGWGRALDWGAYSAPQKSEKGSGDSVRGEARGRLTAAFYRKISIHLSSGLVE